MRIVVFANGGELPLRALEVLRHAHAVIAVVRPAPARSLRAAAGRLARRVGLRPVDPLDTWLRESGLTVVHAAAGDPNFAPKLRALAPDVMCIATYPSLLSQDILDVPRLGVLNVHTSLLPRYRGPNPYVWMYFNDDRECGVTIHWAVRREDAGPILAQEAMDIPRGGSINDLHPVLSRRGAILLGDVVDRLTAGRIDGRAQDDALATQAPRVARGTPLVPFQEWGAERVWHFLAGLYPHFQEPLTDGGGRPIVYRGVAGFELKTARGRPGELEGAASGWKLWCRDGVVYLRDRATC